MALTQLPIELSIPPAWFTREFNQTPVEGTDAVAAANECHLAVFRAPRAGVIRKIAFEVTAAAAWVGTAKARVEQVSATTGLCASPGTLWAVGTEGTFTPTAGATIVTLDTDATVAAGDLVAVGIRATAYTSGSFTIAYRQLYIGTRGAVVAFPYALNIFGSSHDNLNMPIFGIELSDGSKYPVAGMGALMACTDYTWASNTSPDRRGVRWKQPFTGELVGFSQVDDTLINDWSFILYDADGVTVLYTSGTIDGDVRGVAARCGGVYPIPATQLTKDSYYRLVILPLTTTARYALTTITVADAGSMGYWPGGSDWSYTTINGAPAAEGDWTNSTTEKPIGLFLNFRSIDLGSAGSGGLRLAGHGGLAA